MKKKFAVFDIDGTIGRDSLFHQIVDVLAESGKIPIEHRENLEQKSKEYKQREHVDAYRNYTDAAVDTLFANLKSLQVSDYREAVDTVIDRAAQHVYVYTRELITELKKQGYFLIALSGSENYSVERFTEQFGFDIALGEQYEQKNGVFTGKIHHVYDRKETFIKQFVVEHNLTYEGSIAVGDSLSDSTMLEIVENPIAFNPEDTLYDEATKKGWKVVIERKNTIIELRKDDKSGQYILA